MTTAVEGAAGAAKFAPGMQVRARCEDWLVVEVAETAKDGTRLDVRGTSPLVRDQRAVFFAHPDLDQVTPLRPEDTELVADDSPECRRSRLFIDALIRKTPLPLSEQRLATVGTHLVDDLAYQREPAKTALRGLRPRLLIADAVGLGKTLEAGLLLSELIRRGRGERILVITPKHILEQFQHELWTRFAIPLVRLDSAGIEQIKQRIPAGRNPFSYYKRAIISIDTLRSDRWRSHLMQVNWDAVVIDESHKLINTGTKNNRLAQLLAPKTDALILASATPHNGDSASFGELLSLLDPTAIPDTSDYDEKQLEHLYIRRHKMSPDVSAEIGHKWATRKPPMAIECTASPAEQRVFDELYRVWISPEDGQPAPVTGKGARLFPYTLLKAFLSSHQALAETVQNRIDSIDDGKNPEERAQERAALVTLGKLAAEVEVEQASKFQQLVDELKNTIRVGPHADTRVVIFSERRATLRMLQDALPAALGFTKSTKLTGAVRQLHGGLSDDEQQRIVKDFSLAGSDLRILLTGDIAAEGVNLHRQCHQMIHYDLPWSLITIEQRNGRIDRYGQQHSPEIRALLLLLQNEDPENPSADRKVSKRLLEREDEVHRTLGEAASILGLRDEEAEKAAIMEGLASGASFDIVVPDEPADPFELFMAGHTPAGDAEDYRVPQLFASTRAFVEEALTEVYGNPEQKIDKRWDPDHPEMLVFTPDRELQRRLLVLPKSYLDERRVLEQLRLTFDAGFAQQRLDRARELSGNRNKGTITKQERTETSGWPDVSYLTDQHPVVEWLTDKVLVRLARNTAPVITAQVAQPVFLMQGMYSNAKGHPTVLAWSCVTGLDTDTPRFDDDLVGVLERAGVKPKMLNRPFTGDLTDLQALVPAAVEAMREHMAQLQAVQEEPLVEQLDEYEERLAAWRIASESTYEQATGVRRRHAEQRVQKTAIEVGQLIEQLATQGESMVRVIGVLVPAAGTEQKDV
ncbi:DEAD/DEAH box helicase [Streptomyces mirabilis]|uniref:DEAD/DEAH box helicase n=1 Tax=Streptomyces mirabilis TaxID=68239 RepID=UPI0022577336|nr:DEAD/DEAH box helicase [Streptomyces mirabilis]MCX4429583.1 DEAD/DEAH box helicase [Streptomyces mirabilis]